MTLIRGSEVLVNVIRVPEVGNLAPLASVTLPHGLKLSTQRPITPDLIQPWSATPIAVSTADTSTITFTNIDATAATYAYFRVSYDHTIITRPVDPLWWHGDGGGGGGISELTGDVLAGPGAGTQAATVVGLQGNPVAGTAPSAAEVLTWTGAAWAPAPVAASSTIGILRFTLGPIQNIPDSVTSFQPTTTLHRFTVSGGNQNIVAIPTIVWPGAVPGQVVILQNVNPTGGNWVRLNRGIPEALAMSNANKQIDPGGTMTLVYDGTNWVEVSHIQATRT